MILKDKTPYVSTTITLCLVLISVISIKNGFVNDPAWYWVGAFTVLLLIIVKQKARHRTVPYKRKFRRKIIDKKRKELSEIGI
jgi:hypothetical protein